MREKHTFPKTSSSYNVHSHTSVPKHFHVRSVLHYQWKKKLLRWIWLTHSHVSSHSGASAIPWNISSVFPTFHEKTSSPPISFSASRTPDESCGFIHVQAYHQTNYQILTSGTEAWILKPLAAILGWWMVRQRNLTSQLRMILSRYHKTFR